jgi:hypothetical protein
MLCLNIKLEIIPRDKQQNIFAMNNKVQPLCLFRFPGVFDIEVIGNVNV